MSARAEKIPVTILAGFLGAGKTTLLNRILNADHGLRMAVLVNDFGEINIDSELVTSVQGETISLANGCVCCTIRDDLASAIAELVEDEDPPEYIVTETSGVSDPAAVAMGVVMSARLATRVAVDAIITLVDAEHVRELDQANATLAADQVAAADIVVINKVDLVEAAPLEGVREWVREVAPHARVIDATHADVSFELLLGVGEYSPEHLLEHPGPGAHVHRAGETADHAHDHGTAFATWSWSHPEPLAFERVYEAFRTLPGAVFRGKGVLRLHEVPDRRVIVQMVGKRVTLSKGEPWNGTAGTSQVVLIGTPGGLDPQALQARFEACVAGDEVAGGPSPMARAVVEVLRRP